MKAPPYKKSLQVGFLFEFKCDYNWTNTKFHNSIIVFVSRGSFQDIFLIIPYFCILIITFSKILTNEDNQSILLKRLSLNLQMPVEKCWLLQNSLKPVMFFRFKFNDCHNDFIFYRHLIKHYFYLIGTNTCK